MDSKLEIDEIARRLSAYTAREAGIAVLAHSDAGTIDLFLDGDRHVNIFSGHLRPAGGAIVRLRARRARYYETFDLVGPMAPELFAEMGEQYVKLIQARLTPEEMDELLSREDL